MTAVTTMSMNTHNMKRKLKSSVQERIGLWFGFVNGVIFGSPELVETAIMSVAISKTIDGEGAHWIGDGIPATGKTRVGKYIVISVDGLTFARIQMTPDLMATDVTGSLWVSHIDPKSGPVYVRIEGPMTADVVLLDEITRGSTKSQAAFLEAMGEGQITLYGDKGPTILSENLVVIGTRNPMDHRGTEPIPEAQSDRFLFVVHPVYPARNHRERLVRSKMVQGRNKIEGNSSDNLLLPVLDLDDLQDIQEAIVATDVPDAPFNFIFEMIEKLQEEGRGIRVGPSPRGDIGIIRASQFIAVRRGRREVEIRDVAHVAHRIFDHRVHLSPEAEMKGITSHQVVEKVMQELGQPSPSVFEEE